MCIGAFFSTNLIRSIKTSDSKITIAEKAPEFLLWKSISRSKTLQNLNDSLSRLTKPKDWKRKSKNNSTFFFGSSLLFNLKIIGNPLQTSTTYSLLSYFTNFLERRFFLKMKAEFLKYDLIGSTVE